MTKSNGELYTGLDPAVADTERAATESTTTVPQVEAPALPVETVGRFVLEAPLGSGGMGDVYRAHDPVLQRAVALKILRTGGHADDPAWTRRLLREARAAAALNHPNTVTVFDVGEDQGRIFIAMELLEGKSLRAVMRERKVNVPHALAWLLQAARALLAAHEQGLVHRDVKPDNMFIGIDGSLKLLDFGIAKRDDDDAGGGPDSLGPSSLRTIEGRRAGTPRYMAPEQLAGQPTDARTDQFAWALVAFEMLAGVHPREAPTRSWHPGDDPPPVLVGELRLSAELVHSLEDPIRTGILRALSPRREDRFPSMAPLIDMLTSMAPVPTGALRAPPTFEAPTTRRGRATGFLIAAAAILVGVSLFVRARLVPPGRAVKDAASPRASIVRCSAGSPHTLDLAGDDRIAVLRDHRVLGARGTRNLIALRYEEAEGRPFSRNPVLLDFLRGIHARSTLLEGLHVRGDPLALLVLDQGEEGSFLIGAFEDPFFTHRLPGTVTALAASPFAQEAVIGVTLVPSARGGQDPGAAAYRLTDRVVQVTALVEPGQTTSPAIAGDANHVAFAFVHHSPARSAELHLALLDEQARRQGPVERLAAVAADASLAVAFGASGSSVAVFHVNQARRLEVVTFELAGRSAAAPRVAVDGDVSGMPRAARTPRGKWLLAWLAPRDGATFVRAGVVADDGRIIDSFEVAKADATATILKVTSSLEGADVVWTTESGSRTVASIASVRCIDPRE